MTEQTRPLPTARIQTGGALGIAMALSGAQPSRNGWKALTKTAGAIDGDDQ